MGKFVLPSRFKANVDAGQCSSCETCLERCYFDAISMDGDDGTALALMAHGGIYNSHREKAAA